MTRIAAPLAALVALLLLSTAGHAAPKPKLHGPRRAIGDGTSAVRIELSTPGRATAPEDVLVTVEAGAVGEVSKLGPDRLGFDLVAPRVAEALEAEVVVQERRGAWRTPPLHITFEPPPFDRRRQAGRGPFQLSVPERLLLRPGVEASVRFSPAAGVMPELFASEGSLAKPINDGIARWKAAFSPGSAKRPRYGIVAAVSGDRSKVDFGVVSLWGLPRLKTTTARGASVRWRIGGREFGPVFADERGEARLHVLAPPGVTSGEVEAADATGSKRLGQVALGTPPPGAMLAICPSAGSDVIIVALDERGEPRRGDDLEVQASMGTVSTLRRRGAGVYAATLAVPATTDADASIEVQARVRGDAAPRARCVAAPPGVLPRGIAIELGRDRWKVGADRTVSIAIALQYPDTGRPEPADIEAKASHGAVEIVGPSSAAEVTARWTLPSKLPAGRRAVLTASAPAFGLHARATLALEAGPVARLEATADDRWLFGDGSSGTRIVVRAVDAHANAVFDAKLAAKAAGKVGAFRHLGQGRYAASYRAPETADPLDDRIIIRDAPSDTRTTLELPVRPAPKRFSGWLRGGLLTNFSQVTGPLFLTGVAVRLPLLDEALVAGVEGGLAWSAPNVDGEAGAPSAELELFSVPLLGRLAYELPLETVRPYLGVTGGAFIVYSSVTTTTSLQTAGYHAAPAISPLAGADIALGPGRAALEAGYFFAPLDVDVVSGNAGGLDITAGYRLGF